MSTKPRTTKKHLGGRPRKKPADVKSLKFGFRCTPREAKILNDHGGPDWVKRTVLRLIESGDV